MNNEMLFARNLICWRWLEYRFLRLLVYNTSYITRYVGHN